MLTINWISLIPGIIGSAAGITALVLNAVHFKRLHGRPANLRIFFDIRERLVCKREHEFSIPIIFFNEGQYPTLVTIKDVLFIPQAEFVICDDANIQRIFGLESLQVQRSNLKLRIHSDCAHEQEFCLKVDVEFIRSNCRRRHRKVCNTYSKSILIEVL